MSENGGAERKDTLAWLERRRANCATIEASEAAAAETRERARINRLQLDVLISGIANGLHEFSAAVEARLAATEAEDMALAAGQEPGA